MATATERAAIGSEEARLQGKGPAGRMGEGLRNVATGRDDNLAGVDPYNSRAGVGPFNNTGTGVEDRGLFNRDNHHGGLGLGHHNEGMLGNTEEEMARLRINTHITAEGDAYCPNPNLRDLPKEFETRVQVIQRYPEMKTVEKTDFVKEIHHEERTIIVPRTRVIHDDIERIDRVPVVRQVPKTRIEVRYRVVAEEREVTDMVPEVDYMDVPRVEMVPRVITEDVEERVLVPTVREVPVTRMVEVPTGNYCEAPVDQYVTPGDFNLLHHEGVVGGTGFGTGAGTGVGTRAGTGVGTRAGTGVGTGAGAGGLLHRTKSASSYSSSDDDDIVDGDQNTVMPDGTVAPGGRRKKRSLLRRVLHQ